jgi:hypothetical protein
LGLLWIDIRRLAIANRRVISQLFTIKTRSRKLFVFRPKQPLAHATVWLTIAHWATIISLHAIRHVL